MVGAVSLSLHFVGCSGHVHCHLLMSRVHGYLYTVCGSGMAIPRVRFSACLCALCCLYLAMLSIIIMSVYVGGGPRFLSLWHGH